MKNPSLAAPAGTLLDSTRICGGMNLPGGLASASGEGSVFETLRWMRMAELAGERRDPQSPGRKFSFPDKRVS